MNNIPKNNCPFCNIELEICSDQQNVHPMQSHCDANYYIYFKDNKPYSNSFYIKNYFILNHFNDNFTSLFRHRYMPSLCETNLINWDYSSTEKMLEQLKLILAFQ